MQKKGQSFFELIIAIAVISIVVVALVNLGTIAVRNISFARDKTLAGRLTQEAVEWLRSERDADWNTFISRAGTWCLQSFSWNNSGTCSQAEKVPNTPFWRTVVIGLQNPQQVNIRVVVSWQDSGGTKEVAIENVLTDWKSQ